MAKILDTARKIVARDFRVLEHPGAKTCWRCPFGGKDGFCPEKRLS